MPSQNPATDPAIQPPPAAAGRARAEGAAMMTQPELSELIEQMADVERRLAPAVLCGDQDSLECVVSDVEVIMPKARRALIDAAGLRLYYPEAGQ